MGEVKDGKPIEVPYGCVVCGTELGPWEKDYPGVPDPDGICSHCAHRLPPSLVKACYDPFDYAVGLRGGIWIRFEQAKVYGDYVRLDGVIETNLEYPMPRGVDVRIEDIVWCADAPEGS